ncbi:protein polybromo isoform X4 [Tachypleus tridentatus]|uniref:protein polybromo isoform X4 n=1 Tax=Tachypleus tridentatus TaxID=6853 RepID=UPI003FD23B80
MPKRKRIHGSEDSREDGEGSNKRRKVQVDVPTHLTRLEQGEICQELYDTIRNFKTEDGHLLCETFIRAPKRRSLADYYDVVSVPMDLLKIQQKLKTEEYTEVEQMTADIELMVNNAKAYYKKSSQEYKDACDLYDLYMETKADVLLSIAGDQRRDESETDTLSNQGDFYEEENPFEELFTAVMTATDQDGRSISSLFQLLPSKTRYPEYYRVIKEPVDLKTIATRIQNNSYPTLTDLESDLLLMVKNAKLFNEPGSQIYRDAANLRKIIVNKKLEIEQRKVTPAKSSERIRARRMPAGQKWSAITAALQYESDMDDRASSVGGGDGEDGVEGVDEGNDSGPEDADNNPQWQLYETVKTYQSPQGIILSEPFMKLPPRRIYPDYYREIKLPMSLFKIKRRIKSGRYRSTMEVVDDMNLMFENARKYNRPDSKIFKDAVKLQKVMQGKARELINIHMKDSDSEGDGDDRTPKRKVKKGFFITPGSDGRKSRRISEGELPLKKKLKILYKTLVDYVDDFGRPLITMFMEKPSKKDYPDYYKIITNPVDMKTIESNIKNDRYNSEEALVADFKLMFNNCRHYNEEGSQIFRDAETLEKVLLDKVHEVGCYGDLGKSGKSFSRKGRGRPCGVINQKLRNLYDTVKEYTDNRGRKLSVIFNKLPSKTDYPDYFEVIKRPIDLDKIGSRVRSGYYDNLEELIADFLLMFDNACQYNEPDSQIYKDALTLQRIALQTKQDLTEDLEDGVPDVKALVQELITNLFISVYNQQDEEGRCYSDSIVEFSETESSLEPEDPQKPLSLDMIKRNLDRGRYRRLDRFQEDVFEVFEQARRKNRTDSQVFEDSVELQSYFIKMRDELCKNGELLKSPALHYTESDLQASVEALKSEKLPKEQQEAEMEPRQEKDERESLEMSTSDSVVFRGQVYHVGDFVYVEPREKAMEPHIIHISKLRRDSEGEQWIYGCWFYRPNETFHLATRKFLQKEVFKSDNYNSTPLNQVLGKCYVMFVKEYFKLKPEGFDDKDVYVCESRYSAKVKAFKKIKIWSFTPNEYIQIVPREEPLPIVRVPSVFKDGVERFKEESMDYDDTDLKVIERQKPNILCETQNEGDSKIYYEQFSIPSGAYKLGDCCYVRTEQGRTLIGKIDQMWVDKESGHAYFHGPWFVTPQEVQHPLNRLFYRQEVFLSSIEDTNPLLSVVARCAVLDVKDYIVCRPTEISEKDLFICESRYMENERQIRKLSKGLKKPVLSPQVTEDEFYFFRKPINPQKSDVRSGNNVRKTLPSKVVSTVEMSPLMYRAGIETDNEESNDIPPPTTPREDQESVSTPLSTTKKVRLLQGLGPTPVSTTKKTKSVKRIVTGYILFACEVRKRVVTANPDRTFGEISRLIGAEWRNLPAATKAEYEERAQKQNEEMAAKETTESGPQSPASGHGDNKSSNLAGGEKGENTVYECSWDSCDHQFEDLQDLIDHLLTEPNGHVHLTYKGAKGKEGEYQCLWTNCSRIKKGVPPFPSFQRLLRHLKEVHLKTSSKQVLPENRNRNFLPSQRNGKSGSGTTPGSNSAAFLSGPYSGQPSGPGTLYSPQATPMYPGMYSSPYVTQGHGGYRPAPPIFVSTPPRTQRLLHSSIYIKYIEGLKGDSRHISDWDAQLKATKDNTTVSDPHRLPVHWLANGAGNHGNVVNAFWALRDFMLRDALNISKIL